MSCMSKIPTTITNIFDWFLVFRVLEQLVNGKFTLIYNIFNTKFLMLHCQTNQVVGTAIIRTGVFAENYQEIAGMHYLKR